MKLTTIRTILLIIAVAGVINNSGNGSLESNFAYVICLLCALSAVGIEAYRWRKKKKETKKN